MSNMLKGIGDSFKFSSKNAICELHSDSGCVEERDYLNTIEDYIWGNVREEVGDIVYPIQSMIDDVLWINLRQ